MGKYASSSIGFLVLLLVIILTTGQAYGQEQNADYLKYQEPQTSSASIFSTLAYIVTLLFTFAAVIGLAYLASRILGRKLGIATGHVSSRILTTIPLGTNRSLQVVDIAGKVLILGVTDHTVTLVQEINDIEEIQKLRNNTDGSSSPPFEQVFQRQLMSLQNMSQKFPNVFGANRSSESESEKR